MTLGTGLTISAQSIGVATESHGFEGVDGILGIGPTDLTNMTLSPDKNQLIPTCTDSLFADKTIRNNELGIFYRPGLDDVFRFLVNV